MGLTLIIKGQDARQQNNYLRTVCFIVGQPSTREEKEKTCSIFGALLKKTYESQQK